jgi:hypothetical protein
MSPSPSTGKKKPCDAGLISLFISNYYFAFIKDLESWSVEVAAFMI